MITRPNFLAIDGGDTVSSIEPQAPVVDHEVMETLAANLGQVGWSVIDDAVPTSIVDALRAELTELDDDALARAGIGRGANRQEADAIRRDRVHWLEPVSDASKWYFDWIESVRLGLNRNLLLGLFDYECHLAWYAPDAFYATHVDAFRGDDNRKVSTVLYLNDNWQPGDGGELVLYEPIAAEAASTEHAASTVVRTVSPTGGTLVCFLSEEIPHEVRATTCDRFSIAGWYRVNGTGRLDPPVFRTTE